jgi:Phage endonuclease I
LATTSKTRYRSGLERAFADLLKENDIKFKYEGARLKYHQPAQERTYTPDFQVLDVYIETKGRLTSADRKKMLLVKDQHPDKTIVMVFDRAVKKLYKGSPTTYADWCIQNNMLYLDLKQVKENPQCLFSTTQKKKDLSLKIPPKKKQKP